MERRKALAARDAIDKYQKELEQVDLVDRCMQIVNMRCGYTRVEVGHGSGVHPRMYSSLDA